MPMTYTNSKQLTTNTHVFRMRNARGMTPLSVALLTQHHNLVRCWLAG